MFVSLAQDVMLCIYVNRFGMELAIVALQRTPMLTMERQFVQYSFQRAANISYHRVEMDQQYYGKSQQVSQLPYILLLCYGCIGRSVVS